VWRQCLVVRTVSINDFLTIIGPMSTERNECRPLAFQADFVLHAVIHYQLTEHTGDGFFDLLVSFLGRQTGKQLGGFKLRACLATMRKPPFQTGWHSARRVHFACPWWYYFHKAANVVGLSVMQEVSDFDNGPLIVSSLSEVEAEWHWPSPHLRLIDRGSIGPE